jgi:Helix-turn-helix domain
MLGVIAMDLRHFNQEQLARRWNISPRTLERWRWLGQGPEYLKIGGRVLYRLADVEAFEAEQIRQRTTDTPSPAIA